MCVGEKQILTNFLRPFKRIQILFQAPEIPSEILIDRYKLQDLCAETAKLKSQGAMESIPQEKITKLLNILELNIRDGSKVCPLPTTAEEEDEVKIPFQQQPSFSSTKSFHTRDNVRKSATSLWHSLTSIC